MRCAVGLSLQHGRSAPPPLRIAHALAVVDHVPAGGRGERRLGVAPSAPRLAARTPIRAMAVQDTDDLVSRKPEEPGQLGRAGMRPAIMLGQDARSRFALDA